MAQTSPVPSPRTPHSSPLPLHDKSSKNHDSKTTKTSLSKTPQLQSCLVFQKLALGTSNLPLVKRLRTQNEQMNSFQETKEHLISKLENIQKRIGEKQKNMVSKCRDLRGKLGDLGGQK